MKRLTICLFTSLLILGCAGVENLKPGAGGQTFEIRGKTYDQIWKAVVRTTTRSLTIVESSKKNGSLKAKKEAGLTSLGEVVGVFIHPTTKRALMYTVEVQSLKRVDVKTDIIGRDWTSTIITGIKAELDQ